MLPQNLGILATLGFVQWRWKLKRKKISIDCAMLRWNKVRQTDGSFIVLIFSKKFLRKFVQIFRFLNAPFIFLLLGWDSPGRYFQAPRISLTKVFQNTSITTIAYLPLSYMLLTLESRCLPGREGGVLGIRTQPNR